VKEFFFEIGEYLAKLQAGTWLSRALFRLLAVWWPGGWPVKFFFENRLRFHRITSVSLWLHFFGPSCIFLLPDYHRREVSVAVVRMLLFIIRQSHLAAGNTS